jgi:hypothetical protein
MSTAIIRPAGAVGVETLDPGVFPYDAWDLDYTDPAVPTLALQAPWGLKAGLIPRALSLPLTTETSHTRAKTDRYTDYLITTGSSSDYTFVPPTLADAKSIITLWKVDSGTKEVVFDPPGSETIIWPGGSGTSVRVGLQGQHVTLMPTSAGWLIVSGVVQPVAGEPDVGGGVHHIADASRSTTLLVNTSTNTGGTWSAAVTVSGVPSGTSEFLSGGVILVTGTNLVAFEKATGVTLSDITTGSNYRKYRHWRIETATRFGAPIWIPLDASKQFKWCTFTNNTSVEIESPTAYKLGPV